MTRLLLAAPSAVALSPTASLGACSDDGELVGLTPRRSSSSTTACARTSLNAIASASVPVGIAMWPVTVSRRLGHVGEQRRDL